MGDNTVCMTRAMLVLVMMGGCLDEVEHLQSPRGDRPAHVSVSGTFASVDGSEVAIVPYAEFAAAMTERSAALVWMACAQDEMSRRQP